MRLVIAEKPSVAKAIASALKINGRSVKGAIEGPDTVITWCVGHLVAAKEPRELDEKYKQWNYNNLPIIPEKMQLKVIPSAKDQWKVVKALLNDKRFTHVVNATDSGREGELIFRNVYDFSGSKLPIKRLWTASLEENALREKFASLADGSEYDNLAHAARARRDADWLIGMNTTTIVTLVVQAGGRKTETAMSVGRVKTPTLAMIVEQEDKIKNFKPVDFWTIRTSFKQGDVTYYGDWFRGEGYRFGVKDAAEEIVAKISGKKAEITEFNVKEEKKRSPLLYDLTTLQREANEAHGFTASKTLKICQSLYEEHKVLSYPRTNSRYLTEAEGKTLPGILQKLESLGGVGTLISERPFKEIPSRFVNDAKVEDHFAIIPTGDLPGNLDEDEIKIFSMVLRRTVAAFYQDRVDEVTKIVTLCEEETFKTSGRVIKQEGWWKVNPSDKSKDVILPAISPDALTEEAGSELKKGQTSPPPRLTEATLLSRMQNAGREIDDEELKDAIEEGGLGTPATRSEIIEDLKRRKFIEVKGKSLRPTEIGIFLIGKVPDILKKPVMTAEWERKLSLISKGEYDHQEFLQEIKDFVSKLTIFMRPDNIDEYQERSKGHIVGSCPKCSSDLALRSGKYGTFVSCTKKSCKISYSSDENGVPLSGFCIVEGCGGPVKRRKSGSRCLKCGDAQVGVA